MDYSYETKIHMKQDEDQFIDEKIKEYSIKFFLGSKQIYIDKTIIESGEIRLYADDVCFVEEG